MKTRAFTLLEVAVALALMSIVIGTVAAVMAQVLAENRRAQAHSELMRDATFASELLNTELRQAGLGVPLPFDSSCNPDGAHIRRECDASVAAGCLPLYGTGPGGVAFAAGDTGASFYGAVIVAAGSQVGIVADLARPDAQYNAYGPLHNRPTAESDAASAFRVVWHTENNGGCAPGNNCNLNQFSTFFADTTATQICSGASAASRNARTCPWGMRRVVAGEHIQIVAGDMTWSNAEVASPLAVTDVGTPGGRLALDLNRAFDMERSNASFAEDGIWSNRLQGEGPGGIRGVGWVTTLDRVFFFHDAASKTLQRVQCSGDPDPNNPNWPDAAATVMPPIGNLDLTPPATAPATAEQNTCVGPEVVARNVQSVAFTYLNRVNATVAAPVSGVVAPTCPSNVFTAPTTGKSSIRRIDYVLTFEKTLQTGAATPPIVRHSVRGSIRLQNL